MSFIDGALIYSRNLWIIKFRARKQFIFWGHLGLGDQICSAKLLEHWSDLGCEVHVPCKRRNLDNLEQMFAYLEGVSFHPISDNPDQEAY